MLASVLKILLWAMIAMLVVLGLMRFWNLFLNGLDRWLPRWSAAWRSRRGHRGSVPAEGHAGASEGNPAAGRLFGEGDPRNELYLLGKIIDDEGGIVSGLADFRALRTYQVGVERIRNGFPPEKIFDYAVGENGPVSILALEAMGSIEWKREYLPRTMEFLSRSGVWWFLVALELLAQKLPPEEPIAGAILIRAQPSWFQQLRVDALREFARRRLAGGEALTFGNEQDGLDEERRGMLVALMTRADAQLFSPLLRELSGEAEEATEAGGTTAAEADGGQVAPGGTATDGASPAGHDAPAATPSRAPRRARPEDGKPPDGPPPPGPDFLRSVGRLRDPRSAGPLPEPVMHADLAHTVSRLVAAVDKKPSRSVVVAGDRGVGKSAALCALADRLSAGGWWVFTAGHTEIAAGTMFIGSLELKLRTIRESIRKMGKVLWIIPDFHELLESGKHTSNPFTGVLDQILPWIESGEIVVAGETEPGPLDRLLRTKPSFPVAVEVVHLAPLDGDKPLDVAREWVQAAATAAAPPLAAEEDLREAWQLARQFLTAVQPPGNLLDLLRLTAARLRAEGKTPVRLGRDELLATVGGLTGLPPVILDDRVPLNLDDLRRHFRARVLGQPEAVECLVDRVAMIKAGVCDTTRPLGVFLFAGPTGTGKTAIAKALAEFLFGSAERMIRLDMSELHGFQGRQRILGGPAEMGNDDAGALVHRIRTRPFSLILLDEIEKADPEIWNLFLQLFDDGRLTDAAGRTADFRHAMIIMTSNLGGMVAAGESLGFSPETGTFHPGIVERAIGRAFRREFLNRIDRTVVFRPLGRDTMRQILFGELEETVQRRGLRRFQVVLEWDEAAIDFILEKGFTPDLGARPLKRAVERWLLAPLAEAIVAGEVPAGGALAVVKADESKLSVRFLGAEEDEDTAGAPEVTRTAGAPRSLEEIALDPEGTADEVETLRQHHQALRVMAESPRWCEEKDSSLALMSAPGFWSSPERFMILGGVEYMDRVREGIERLDRVFEKLEDSRRQDRVAYPRAAVAQLAERLYLLEAAARDVNESRPRQAFFAVEAVAVFGRDRPMAEAFAEKIGGMYLAWARQRGMRLDLLVERPGGGGDPYRLVAAVSGFGSYTILAPEDGLHVLEVPEPERGERDYRRYRVRVRVLPMPDSPEVAGRDPQRIDRLREEARRALEAVSNGDGVVVRRYREEPSPLVRDVRRGWRTGRSDRVFEGNFDLIQAQGG